MKALSIKYKRVFIELKNIFYLLRYCKFCEKFPIQTYGPQVFRDHFSKIFKNCLKFVFCFNFWTRDLKLLRNVPFIVLKTLKVTIFKILTNKNFRLKTKKLIVFFKLIQDCHTLREFTNYKKSLGNSGEFWLSSINFRKF